MSGAAMTPFFSDRDRLAVEDQRYFLLNEVEGVGGPLARIEAEQATAVGLAIDGPGAGEWVLLVAPHILTSLTIGEWPSTMTGDERSG